MGNRLSFDISNYGSERLTPMASRRRPSTVNGVRVTCSRSLARKAVVRKKKADGNRVSCHRENHRRGLAAPVRTASRSKHVDTIVLDFVEACMAAL